jgi:hypothetical protein
MPLFTLLAQTNQVEMIVFFFSTVFLFSLFLLPRRPTLPLSRSVYWWTVVSQKTPGTLYTVNFHYLTNIIHLTITIRGETVERHKAKKSIPDTTSGREIEGGEFPLSKRFVLLICHTRFTGKNAA